MRRAFVAMGSNVGDRLATLRSAVATIRDGGVTDTSLCATSRVYETRPVGPSTSPYLNAAMLLDTRLSPDDLLDALKAIEDAHGRERRERWGPRTLDLDLVLVFEDGVSVERQSARLKLPHPEATSRDFVMRPLLDLDPRLRVGDHALRERLAALSEAELTVLEVLGDTLSPG